MLIRTRTSQASSCDEPSGTDSGDRAARRKVSWTRSLASSALPASRRASRKSLGWWASNRAPRRTAASSFGRSVVVVSTRVSLAIFRPGASPRRTPHRRSAHAGSSGENSPKRLRREGGRLRGPLPRANFRRGAPSRALKELNARPEGSVGRARQRPTLSELCPSPDLSIRCRSACAPGERQ